MTERTIEIKFKGNMSTKGLADKITRVIESYGFKVSSGTDLPLGVGEPLFESLRAIASEDRKEKISQEPIAAFDYLDMAVHEMKDRAVTYDNPKGERSMFKTVEMFNALTESSLTEEQGWKFMALLKLVRSEQGNFKADNFVDCAAYAGLAGETAAKNAVCED